MDDTTQSRTSDVAASGATRKRRSSILKSQRPPRTPFCELEFNVCTPTDTTKSRRVSFSRRTGVAEFATNEATTTWKNFYEEHNKSLESSGNDSEMNHGKQPVAHLGKRIFDQQFEECEAYDFAGTLNPAINISSSINNMNFTRLETTDTKLSAPQNNFELSAMTETQSKLFGDNLAVTCTSEISSRIDVNFSAIQQMSEKDDLDEIQKDLQRSNIVCPGPFTGQNMSEYIEVDFDLNATHAAIPNDESDMSITDTVHSPKVQDVSKSVSIDKKVNISNKDWVTDKENIVLNPYVAPRESVNFAVTEIPDEVLVFDGKRLIVETENSKKQSLRPSVPSNPPDRAPQRKTIVLNCNDDLPNFIEDSQLSKNQSCFVGVSESQSFDFQEKPLHRLDDTQNNQGTIIFGDDLDISVTQAVPNLVSNGEKRRTIVYDDEKGNISVTQALPSNIIDKEKRRTIVYDNDNDNISITQAVPAHVIIPTESKEKRKTIVFEDEGCNISMTQAIPTNIVAENNAANRRTIVLEERTTNVSGLQTSPNGKKESKKSRRTIVCEDDTGNISVTHSIMSRNSNERIPPTERRTTVVFESENGNISVTQALPCNIISSKKLNATTFDNDGNISMTQALPANILQGNNEPNRRRTVVFENDTGNLSITQAVTNQVIQNLAHQQCVPEEAHDLNNPNKNNQEKLPEHSEETAGNKRRTIVFQNDAAEISITQAVPIRQVIDNINAITNKHDDDIKAISEALVKEGNLTNNTNRLTGTANDQKQYQIYNMQSTKLDLQKDNHIDAFDVNINKEPTNKRRTVVFDNENADISMTQAVPVSKVIEAVQRKNTEVNNTALPELSNKRRTVVFENDDAEISMTQAVPMNKVIEAVQKENHNSVKALDFPKNEAANKRRTVVFENDDADISMTQAVPMNQVIDTILKGNEALHIEESTNKRRTVIFENDEADISMTQAAPVNQIIDIIQKDNNFIDGNKDVMQKEETTSKRKTVIFENDEADISMTQAAPMNQIIEAITNKSHNIDEPIMLLEKEDSTNKRKTVVFENEDADISMTQATHMNKIIEAIANKNHTIEAPNALLEKESPNKRKTIVFENEDADISMTQSAPTNKIIEALIKDNDNIEAPIPLEKEISTYKRETVDFENEADKISINQANPKNQVIDFIKKEVIIDLNDKSLHHKSIVIEETKANIPIIGMVSSTEVLHTEKDFLKHDENESETVKKATSQCDTSNNKNNILYDDAEGDILTTYSVSSSIIKKRTIVVESVESLLENKDLLMEIDRLTDDINDNSVKMSSDYDASMSDLSDEEFGESNVIKSESDEVRVTETIQESFGLCKREKSRISSHDTTQIMSKPIPAELAILEQEILDKPRCDVTKRGTFSDVLVYQSYANTHNILLTTDKGDSEISREDLAHEEKKDSTLSISKIISEVKTPNQEELIAHNDSKYDLAENSKDSAVRLVDPKLNNSILNDLLDMSHSSFDGAERKDIVAVTSSIDAPPNTDPADMKESGMFYITKDSDDDRQEKSESPSIQSSTREMRQIQGRTPLSIEYKDDEVPLVRDLQSKLSIIKNVMRENPAPDFNLNEDTDSKVNLDGTRRKSAKTFKMANDTKELLEMLSDLTDKRLSRNLPLEELPEIDDIPETRFSIENKVEEVKPEPTRFNRTLRRQSVVLSREDLLNNLSMASAALQKARSDFDDSDSFEVKDTPNISPEPRKSVRMSADVAKTLNFDDDSMTESSQTPLKKTAFGEISYMRDGKSNVIPDFMTNISDGIKELMDDLVKPMSDAQPFTTNESPTNKEMVKNPSTCSTQIQANLLTSSQIDLHTDLYSTTESIGEMKFSSVDMITDAMNRSMSRAQKSPDKSTPVLTQSEKSSEDITSDDAEDKSVETTVHAEDKPLKNSVPSKPIASRQVGEILIFDQHNPLNNVLLLPMSHAVDVHKYDPIKPEIQEVPEKEQETVTDQYRVEVPAPCFIADNLDKSDIQSTCSNASKPMSIDQYTEPVNNKVRDMEINTDIVMKANEELLQASSSLTLVDDTFHRKHSPSNSLHRDTNSPVKIIYKVEEPPETKDSDFTSTDEIEKPTKSKKRIYSPAKREKHKHCTLSSLDVTPKPANKMQKRSTSPEYAEPIKLPAERDESPDTVISSPVQKSPRKCKGKKPGTAITVQQLMTMVHVDPSHGVVPEKTDSSTTEPRSVVGSHEVLDVATSSEIMSSFTSSNNLRDDSLERGVSANPSKVEWLPSSISTSRSMVGSAESADNIVAMIDSMPFMGSHDCQWECVSGNAWTLLLLHSRLRLTVRFAPTERLRADTPVLKVELETLHQDKKNPIAYLCVVYAGELMRHHMSRGCSAASDVSKLVRRLAAAARLAAHWARAMHDARARLAYSLTTDGRLALKVANTSYRAVWEVSMRLELVVEHARAAPWPRACAVRAARVLPAALPPPPDIPRAALAAPPDWSHAPRTIWKVFRYLKHKKRDDDAV